MSDSKEIVTLDTFLKENKSLGMEEKSEEDLLQPYVKIVQSNTKDKDETGRKYPEGQILYTGTGETFDEVDIVILAYVKVQTPSLKDRNVMVRQYKCAGLLGERKLPFIIFFGGTGIGAFKRFNTDVNKMGRPLFTVRVRMSVEKRYNNEAKADYYIPDFRNIRPIDDLGELQLLKNMTMRFKSVLNTPDVYDDSSEDAIDSIANDEGSKVRPGEALNEDVAPDETPF